MNLKAELEEILRKLPAAMGAYIMDSDGLVVEKAERGPGGDLEGVFIEFMQAFRSLGESAAELSLGPVEEMAVRTAGQTCLFRRINDGYFLVMAMAASGCQGEGAWRLRRAARSMAPDFTL